MNTDQHLSYTRIRELGACPAGRHAFQERFGHRATQASFSDVFYWLIKERNRPDWLGWLMGSCVYCLEALLAAGANIDDQDPQDRTPLHWAVMNGNLEVVEILIERGADVNAEDSHQRTPLRIAAREGFLEVVELLERAKQRQEEDL